LTWLISLMTVYLWRLWCHGWLQCPWVYLDILEYHNIHFPLCVCDVPDIRMFWIMCLHSARQWGLTALFCLPVCPDDLLFCLPVS
jgi:hypothetical protein